MESKEDNTLNNVKCIYQILVDDVMPKNMKTKTSGGGQAELFNEAHRGGPRVSANPNDRYTRRVSPTSEARYQDDFG